MRFRRKARINTFYVLYIWDMRGDSLDKVYEEILQEKNIKREEVKEYMKKLLDVIKERLTEIDSLISEYVSQQWSFDRIGYIERNVLRLGVAELLFINPPSTGMAFNDYIDIVKKFGDKKSARFVNGVLSRIYKDHKATSSAKKEG